MPRIYVGNLAESVTRDDLRALFSKIGRVGGALVITDKLTGKSRGFGFVEMVEVEDAINLFGCAYVGIALPDSVLQGEDLLANPWDTPGAIWTPNPNNGHCVLAVAYDGNGMTVVTWGASKRMSWDFWAACGDEAYALDAPAWFDANGRSPSGYSSDDLNADLQAIPSVADPSVEPGNFSPVPPPSPS